MSTNHNFSNERRAEAVSNRGPSAYQPTALPLGHTGSHGCVNEWLALHKAFEFHRNTVSTTLFGCDTAGASYFRWCCVKLCHICVNPFWLARTTWLGCANRLQASNPWTVLWTDLDTCSHVVLLSAFMALSQFRQSEKKLKQQSFVSVTHTDNVCALSSLHRSGKLVGSKQNLRWFRTKPSLVPNKTFVGFRTKLLLVPNKTFRWFRTKHSMVPNKTVVGSQQNLRWFQTKLSLVPNKTFVGFEQNLRKT